MNIPFLDLVKPHIEIENELTEAFRSTLRSGRFVGGPEVDQFEKEYAEYCETKYCVAVNSGTDAIRFALIAAGIGSGDVVLTVANTFIATTEAISQTGASFDFIDIDEQNYTMNPDRLLSYLKGSMGSKVRAIVPVHLYGQTSNMDPIMEIASEYGLKVIEDACQAHGARYYSEKQRYWQRAGSIGTAAAFSFYPGKNLGACGEGGAITTNDHRIATTAKMLRDHGQAEKYFHEIEGYNGRLDAIQCSILRIKLRGLDGMNERRRKAASIYSELMSNMTDVIRPYEPQWSKSVYHLYVIRAKERDELQKYLEKNGIGTGLHYPLPLHLQKCYADRQCNRELKITCTVSESIISIPLYPQITPEQQTLIVECIRSFYSSIDKG
jgi:dTDP-4-amino-4,6-dideoxygalactose transaminase